MDDNMKEAKLEKLVQKLTLAVEKPPSKKDYEQQGTWIKEKAQEVKDLLKILLHSPEGVKSRFNLLDQLSAIRQKLSELNRERKKNKPPTKEKKRDSSKYGSRKPSSTGNQSQTRLKSKAKSPGSMTSQKSQSNRSASVKSNKSKQSKQSKKKKSLQKIADKSKKDGQNTPKFNSKKKLQLKTNLGSFSKPIETSQSNSKLRESNQFQTKRSKQETLQTLRSKHRSPSSDISGYSAHSSKRKLKKVASRSTSSKKKINKSTDNHQFRPDLSSSAVSQELSVVSRVSNLVSRQRQESKNSKHSQKSDLKSSGRKMNREKIKKLLESSSSSCEEEYRNVPSRTPQDTLKQEPDLDSSSQSQISLQGELQRTLAAVDLKRNFPVESQDLNEKYRNFLELERQLNRQNGPELPLDEEAVLKVKLETVSKERLLRDYRVLFMRNREQRKLLQEFADANSHLQLLNEDSKQQLQELYTSYKEQKDMLRSKSKDAKKQQKEIEKLTKDMFSLPKVSSKSRYTDGDYQTLRHEHDKLITEVTMQREFMREQQYRIEQLELENKELNQLLESKNESIKEMNKGNLQDLYYRTQQEMDFYKDQVEGLREQVMQVKIQVEKEQIKNSQLENQVDEKIKEIGLLEEQKSLEINALQSQVQAANSKQSYIENQMSHQKFQEGNLQEQVYNLKDNIFKLEEELRIATLKIENREKELQDLKSKELQNKKRIIDLETQLQIQQSKQQPDIQAAMKIQETYKINQNFQKELATEKIAHQKTIQELSSIKRDLDYKDRDIRDLEQKIQMEQQEKQQLKTQLLQTQLQLEAQVTQLYEKLQIQDQQTNKENQQAELSYRNQELIITSQSQRIQELESEIQKFQSETKNLLKQVESSKLKNDELEKNVKQLDSKNEEYYTELKTQQKQIDHLNNELEQMKVQNDELVAELEELDKLNDTYKNKYLSTKYENRKLKETYNEKENIMKNTYSSELDRLRSDRENLEKKIQTEQQTGKVKEKKLKVISELQSLIKEHKRSKI